MKTTNVAKLVREAHIPDKCFWYSIDGRSVFTVLSASGMLTTTVVAVLMAPGPFGEVELKEGFHRQADACWYTIKMYPACESPEEIKEKIATAIATVTAAAYFP